MPTRRLVIAAAVVAATVPTAAWAHARLVSSSPARDAAGASPRSIRLTFSERMVAAFSSFELVNARGVRQPVRTAVSEDGLTISGRPASRLIAGTYTVTWAIASVDGHRMTGAFNFTVR